METLIHNEDKDENKDEENDDNDDNLDKEDTENENNKNNNKNNKKIDFNNEKVKLCNDIILFLFEPSSSIYSNIYIGICAMLVLCHILQVCLETCDGPNQYEGRNDLSAYQFLPNENTYRNIEMGFCIPLLLDALFRVGFVLYMQCCSELTALVYFEIWTRSLRWGMLLCELLGILPFLSATIANKLPVQQFARLVFRVIDLLLISKVLRWIQNIPAVWAIRLTLYRALPQLILPIFFFIVFNMTAAVILYFLEPCYDRVTCPWKSMFDSTFYAVVTMTTTGYGNQIPVLEYTRLVACMVMIFGALFMSMPLAIIGNEYEAAWKVVNKTVQQQGYEAKLKLENDELERLRHKMPLAVELATTPSTSLQLSLNHNDIINQKMAEIRSPIPIGGYKLNSVIPLNNNYTNNNNNNNRKTILHKRISLIQESDENENSESSNSDDENNSSNNNNNNNNNNNKENGNNINNINKVNNNIDPLVQSISEPFSKIILLIQKADSILAISEKISPSILLSACELTGWLNPLCYSIRNASHDIQQKCLVFQSECTLQTDLLMNEYNSIRMLTSTEANKALKEATEKEKEKEIENSISNENDIDNNKNNINNNNNTDIIPQRKRLSVMGGNLLEFVKNVDKVKENNEEQLNKIRLEKEKLQNLNGTISNIPERKTTILSDVEQTNLQLMSRKSIISSLKNYALNKRSVLVYSKQLRWAQSHPRSWRAALWLALEQPHVSTQARMLQIVLIIFICLSMLVLYTESLPSWSNYGESSRLCGKVLEQYCADKIDNTLDPACFVQIIDTWTGITFPSTEKLQYSKDGNSPCTNNKCFGITPNFGGITTNMSCLYKDGDLPKLDDTYTQYYLSPFQGSDSLILEYGYITIFTGRKKAQQITSICNRLECDIDHVTLVNGRPIWLFCESLFNAVFLVELLVRMSVVYNIGDFFLDKMNFLDIMAILPFILDLIITASRKGGIEYLNLAIIASTPEPIILVALRSLKIFRLFSLTRHFKASKVLYETARRVWPQILGIVSLLLFMTVLFGLIMYELERGTPCYVGDSNCIVPDDAIVKQGQRILINKLGDLSKIPNMFYGIWFSIVTMLTVGYGEIVPVSNGGMSMAVCLMLFGAMYMAMPLTASATNFYLVHDLYKEKTNKQKLEFKKEQKLKEKRKKAKQLKKIQKADNDESDSSDDDSDNSNSDNENENEQAINNIVNGSFDLQDSKKIKVPFKFGKDKIKKQIEISPTLIYAEKVKTAHELKLKNMKRSVHLFFINKLKHIQFILEKLLLLMNETDINNTTLNNNQNNNQNIKGKNLIKLKKLPMYIIKSQLFRKLRIEMLDNMRTIALSIANNVSENGIPDNIEIDKLDEMAMLFSLENLQRTYRAGLTCVHNYLETIMLDIILKEYENRKNQILKYIENLNSPPKKSPTKPYEKDKDKLQINIKNKKKSPSTDSDGSNDSDHSDDEIDDEVYGSDLEAKPFRKDTLLGKYQILINKLNNVMKIADEDIQCLCKIMTYVNKNIDEDMNIE